MRRAPKSRRVLPTIRQFRRAHTLIALSLVLAWSACSEPKHLNIRRRFGSRFSFNRSIRWPTPKIRPPALLGLLAYSYATGVFSSRHIERASYENLAVRLLCADTHPDHDTLCTFRRINDPLLTQAFAQILELSARCGVLKVGQIMVAIDGTKILANASKHAAVSHGHGEKSLRTLDLEIAELLAKAEQADATPCKTA